MKRLVRSRKFWLTVTAIIGAIGTAATGEMTWGQAIQIGVGAIAANILGIAVEDAGAMIGAGHQAKK